MTTFRPMMLVDPDRQPSKEKTPPLPPPSSPPPSQPSIDMERAVINELLVCIPVRSRNNAKVILQNLLKNPNFSYDHLTGEFLIDAERENSSNLADILCVLTRPSFPGRNSPLTTMPGLASFIGLLAKTPCPSVAVIDSDLRAYLLKKRRQ